MSIMSGHNWSFLALRLYAIGFEEGGGETQRSSDLEAHAVGGEGGG